MKTGVPTAADTPFALRQIWINPDKDYIDMPQFFKELEITIALPHYTDSEGTHYAELNHITYDPAGMSARDNMLNPEKNDNAGPTITYDDPNHTVTLKWANLYLEYGQEYFTPYFKWTTNVPKNGATVTWTNTTIKSTGNSAPQCYEGKTPGTGAAAVGGKSRGRMAPYGIPGTIRLVRSAALRRTMAKA